MNVLIKFRDGGERRFRHEEYDRRSTQVRCEVGFVVVTTPFGRVFSFPSDTVAEVETTTENGL